MKIYIEGGAWFKWHVVLQMSSTAPPHPPQKKSVPNIIPMDQLLSPKHEATCKGVLQRFEQSKRKANDPSRRRDGLWRAATSFDRFGANKEKYMESIVVC